MIIKQGKTNIKYLFIVIVLAVIVGGGVLYCYLNLPEPEYESSPISFPQKTEKGVEEGSSSLSTNDDLLHKLFPNLEFKNGQAISLEDSQYEGIGLNLFLNEKIEDYFINKEEKNLLLIVSLEGVAHAGGLYHSYLGLFDLDGDLLTPFSVFPEPNVENPYGDEYYDFHRDEVQFGADQGEFGFYDCKGVKYIAFASHGCPNGTCCFGKVNLFRINNGEFEEIQTIDNQSLAKNDFNIQSIISPFVEAAADSEYGLRMILSDEKIIIKKVPPIADDRNCQESDYKVLDWDKDSCLFE
jgi:hypothetical protein